MSHAGLFACRAQRGISGERKKCVPTLKESSLLFSIKPKTGVGRMVICPEAFSVLQALQPRLILEAADRPTVHG